MSAPRFTTSRGWLAAAALMLMLPLAGCHVNVVKAAVAPPPPPMDTVSVPPPSHPTEPLPPEPVVEVPVTPAPVIPPPKVTPPRRRPTAPPPQQTVAAATPPPIDLGQLTAGDEAGNSAFRQQTEDLIKAQNRRLITMPSAVAVQHVQQLEQARLFLRQADEAWKKVDIEGARNLATKAKVLLDEIAE